MNTKRALLPIILLLLLVLIQASPNVESYGQTDYDLNLHGVPYELLLNETGNGDFTFYITVDATNRHTGELTVKVQCSSDKGECIMSSSSVTLERDEKKELAGIWYIEGSTVNRTTITISASGEGTGTGPLNNEIIRKNDKESFVAVFTATLSDDDPLIDIDPKETAVPLAGVLVLAIALMIAGGYVPYHNSLKNIPTKYIMAFGSGVVIGGATLHMLPEAVESAPVAGIIGLGLAVLIMVFIERLEHSKGGGRDTSRIARVAGAFSLHNFLDGIALSLAAMIYSIDPGLAGVMILALVLHKIPAATAFVTYLKEKGQDAKQVARVFSIFLSTMVAGAIVGLAAFQNISDTSMALILGFAAGLFLNVGVMEIFPLEKRFSPDIYRAQRKAWNLFFAGIIFMAFFMFIE